MNYVIKIRNSNFLKNIVKKIKSYRLEEVAKHIIDNGWLTRVYKDLLQFNHKNYFKNRTKDLNKHFTKEEIMDTK